MEEQPHGSFSQMVGKTAQPEQPQVVPWEGSQQGLECQEWPQECCVGWFPAQPSRGVWTTLSVTFLDSWGGAVPSQELDVVILVCPFQSREFWAHGLLRAPLWRPKSPAWGSQHLVLHHRPPRLALPQLQETVPAVRGNKSLQLLHL